MSYDPSEFLSYIHSFVKKNSKYHPHILNLKYPDIVHKQINADCLKNFEEILVIGDVHGCYDELKRLLRKADAEKDNVLKIFVGDLINKGPKSIEVIKFIRRNCNSMLAVRGNHEEEVLKEYYLYWYDYQYTLARTNSWIKNLTRRDEHFLNQLPYTISLPSLKTIIVHAGVLPGILFENNSPYDMVHMRNIVNPDLVWEGGLIGTASTLKGSPWGNTWWGPEHVYFGHEADVKPKFYNYATGLDTGCVHGNCLTGTFIYGPRKGKFVSVKASKEYRKPRQPVKQERWNRRRPYSR